MSLATHVAPGHTIFKAIACGSLLYTTQLRLIADLGSMGIAVRCSPSGVTSSAPPSAPIA
jgi:hypothetical protein